MISIKYSLRDKKAKRKSAIRTSISFDGKRILFCPGYSIVPEYWDSKSGLPKSVRGSMEIKSITTNLKELDVKIRHLFDDLTQNGKQNVCPEIFKQKVLNLVKPEKYTSEVLNKTTLLDFMDLFIKDSENGVRLKDNEYQIEENSIKPYRTTRLHIKEFQEKVGKTFLLSDLNQELHDQFSNYLIIDLDLSKNSHSKYIMVLSLVTKYAVKKKLLPSSILSEIEFNTSREDTDNIYLNESEIQLLMDLTDFKNKGEEVVRDLFVLGCYTGLRFSNYSKLNLDYLNDGLLSTFQIKTKKKVTIPIHQNVKEIINKYNGVLPICPTNQEFNRTLKDLGQRIPELNVPFSKQITRGRKITVEETMKWEKLMTHTARRSFCTNMYLMGVPVLTIMAISGHKTEKSFRAYIKATGEEHAQIMQKFWDDKADQKSKIVHRDGVDEH
jgi:integrase